MTVRNRPSLLVHKLDHDKSTALLRSKCPQPELATLVASPMVAIVGKSGIATVCTEGVGWYAHNDLYVLMWCDRYGIEDFIKITYDELMSLVSDEVVDLATFIRSFGDRLEVNFDIWYGYGLGFNQVFNTKVGV